jgi:hypothetical protein
MAQNVRLFNSCGGQNSSPIRHQTPVGFEYLSVVSAGLRGDFLEQTSSSLVNTVNTIAVIDKGIALMFKEAFPANFEVYENACKNREVHVGRM